MAALKKSPLFLVNFVTGISDGMLLPFTVMVAAWALSLSVVYTLSAGIGAASLGALAFGLARMLGEKEEIRHHHPELGAAEAETEISLMHAIGIDPQLTSEMKDKMAVEREQWLEEIREHGLGWEMYDAGRARGGGLQTAGGFLAGGVLVALCFAGLSTLLPYRWPVLPAVWLLLFLAGWCKGRVIGKPALRYALIQLFSGVVASLAVLAILLLLLPSK
ncbi:VIT1/CCC1 transporter family protein [Taibaiella helva]|uniref:VIT1/CCC1 transporter family protein n=1 Tax=Taibaiella helva TaxID=2301235 RepID=UPI000E591252|nr:VIT1/CCC1 transporter family protein [Taibaiella helva]